MARPRLYILRKFRVTPAQLKQIRDDAHARRVSIDQAHRDRLDFAFGRNDLFVTWVAARRDIATGDNP